MASLLVGTVTDLTKGGGLACLLLLFFYFLRVCSMSVC